MAVNVILHDADEDVQTLPGGFLRFAELDRLFDIHNGSLAISNSAGRLD